MEWEVKLIEWMQSNLGGLGAAIGKVFSFIGGETGLFLMVLIMLFCWKKEAGKRLALIVAAVNAWLAMIKALVLRPRPYVEHPDRVEARELVDKSASSTDVAAQGYSFPSTHAASASSLYTSLAREIKKRWMWIVSAAVILLVGVGRLAAGMHYPTDVLAGWVLGLIGAGICVFLEKKIKNEWVRHLILLALTLPGIFYVRTQDYYTSMGMLIGAVAAIHFEEKFVRFEDTRNVWAMILRLAGAFAVYYGLNTLLKLPFGSEFLNSGTFGAFLVRMARYAVVIFVIIGIYPKIFPLFEKVGKKKA